MVPLLHKQVQKKFHTGNELIDQISLSYLSFHVCLLVLDTSETLSFEREEVKRTGIVRERTQRRRLAHKSL